MVDSTKQFYNSLSVPTELIETLNEKPYSKNLMLQFFTNGNPKAYPLNKIIQVTIPILTWNNDGTYTFIYCESYGWLHIFYIYQNFRLKQEVKTVLKKIPNYWVGKSKTLIINEMTPMSIPITIESTGKKF